MRATAHARVGDRDVDHVSSEPYPATPSPRRRSTSSTSHSDHAAIGTSEAAHQHFANAVNAGVHGPGSAIGRRVIGHPIGRVTLAVSLGAWPAGTTTLIARAELVPTTRGFSGFADVAAARAFASGEGSNLIALVRLSDGHIHVFDTGRGVPRPEGPPGAALGTRIEVSALAQQGVFEVIDWVHLELSPRDPMAETPDRGVPHAQGPDPFEAFASNNSSLGTTRLTQIRLALEETTGRDVEVRNAFYANYTANSLGIATGQTLEHMNRDNWDARTDEGHDTLVRELVFGYSPVALGSVLLHEMMHGRADHPDGTQHFYGAADAEGESYAVQYFFVEQAGGPDEELDRVLHIAATGADGSEVDSSLAPQELHRFRVAYATMVALQQLIDGTFAFADAPFAARIGSSRAGALMRELATRYEHTGEVQEVFAWCEANLNRFHLPIGRGPQRPRR